MPRSADAAVTPGPTAECTSNALYATACRNAARGQRRATALPPAGPPVEQGLSRAPAGGQAGGRAVSTWQPACGTSGGGGGGGGGGGRQWRRGRPGQSAAGGPLGGCGSLPAAADPSRGVLVLRRPGAGD